MMVGRLVSFWNGIFSGAMLNFQGVSPYNNGNGIKMIIPRKSQGGIMFSRCLEDPCHFIDSYTEQTWNKLVCTEKYVVGQTGIYIYC